jgi:hypothetical protein
MFPPILICAASYPGLQDAANDDLILTTRQIWENGLQLDPLPPKTRAALREATAVVVKDPRRRFGDEYVDSILAAAGGGNIR